MKRTQIKKNTPPGDQPLVKPALAIVLCFMGFLARGQNIVNPDFEILSTCPTGQTQISKATGWARPTGGTSDYFNSCGYNIDSKISANSGTGFAGGYMELTYSPSTITNYKEYITTQLSAPLTAGVTYTFSFYTAHLYGASPANMLPVIDYTDLPLSEQGNIGALFSVAAPTTANTESGSGSFGATSIVNTFGSGRVFIPAGNTDVYGAGSRNTWVMVTLQYTATGGEQYMTIGQFRHGVTSFPDGQGAYYLFDNFSFSPVSLPVTLQYFNAAKEGATALLKWGTVNEQGNKGFEVERSADGKNFSPIGFVPAQAPGGNSNAALSYKFTDSEPPAGLNYYRLKQIDKDGKSVLSEVKAISFAAVSAIEVYPNPAQNGVVQVKGNHITHISAYTISGQLVNIQVNYHPLENRLEFPEQASGNYILRIVSGGDVHSVKITVQ